MTKLCEFIVVIDTLVHMYFSRQRSSFNFSCTNFGTNNDHITLAVHQISSDLCQHLENGSTSRKWEDPVVGPPLWKCHMIK